MSKQGDMSEGDVDELEDNVQPVCFLLIKLSKSVYKCCTVLASKVSTPHTSRLRFANWLLPYGTSPQLPSPSGITSSRASCSRRGWYTMTFILAGMPHSICSTLPTSTRWPSTKLLTCTTWNYISMKSMHTNGISLGNSMTYWRQASFFFSHLSQQDDNFLDIQGCHPFFFFTQWHTKHRFCYPCHGPPRWPSNIGCTQYKMPPCHQHSPWDR